MVSVGEREDIGHASISEIALQASKDMELKTPRELCRDWAQIIGYCGVVSKRLERLDREVNLTNRRYIG